MKYQFVNRNITISFLLLALMLLLPFGVVNAKDYVRACQAEYSVKVKTLKGGYLGTRVFKFSGKGKVGWYAPNKARERARANIEQCVTKAWEKRHLASKPSECSESNRIYNYPFSGGLHPEITYAVCSSYPGHQSLSIDL